MHSAPSAAIEIVSLNAVARTSPFGVAGHADEPREFLARGFSKPLSAPSGVRFFRVVGLAEAVMVHEVT